MNPYAWLAAAAFVSAAFGAQAQALKPGLWEITNRVQGGAGATDLARTQQEMANLPPEQRKMMQEMMAKHGLSFGSATPGGMNLRACITREMAERNEIPAQGDCKSSSGARTGNSMKISFSCTNPPSTGDGTITFQNPEAYSMKMTVSTTVQGKPQKIDMDATGKRIAADCGAVKPASAPLKK